MSDHGELGLPAQLHAEEEAKIGQGATNFITLNTYFMTAHNLIAQGGNSQCVKQW